MKKHTDDGFQGKNYDEIINSQEFRHAKKDKFRFLQKLSQPNPIVGKLLAKKILIVNGNMVLLIVE